MVDPASLAVVVAALVNGAGGEAGKQAWKSLTRLVGKAFGSHSTEMAALEGAHAATDVRNYADQFAASLAARAHNDERFATDLRVWLTHTEKALAASSGSVTNIVGGQAQVHGALLQGRDFSGPISFGGKNDNSTDPPSE
jgi:hypothetical protein